jgi:secretion/DNA translocation related TadE-like protein
MTLARMRADDSAEQGSTAVLAVVLMAGVLVVAIVAGWWAGVVGARHRAATAADLAALAAAEAYVRGQPPCAAASESARLNDVDVVGCAAVGSSVRVAVVVPVRVEILGRSWPVAVRREAWAGPVSPGTGPAAW